MNLLEFVRLDMFVMLSCLDYLTLISAIVVDLDLGQVGVEGQGPKGCSIKKSPGGEDPPSNIGPPPPPDF